MQMNMHVCYGFNRKSVEARDAARFLNLYWREGNSFGITARNSMNCFTFYVNGYDEDPREAFKIPDVRAFYQDFREGWPYWFLACDLATPSLFVMVLSCLRTVTVTRVPGRDRIRMDWATSEMRAFIDRELGRMDSQCRAAGFSPEEIERRRRLLLDYFGRDWSINPAFLGAE